MKERERDKGKEKGLERDKENERTLSRTVDGGCWWNIRVMWDVQERWGMRGRLSNFLVFRAANGCLDKEINYYMDENKIKPLFCISFIIQSWVVADYM